MTDDDLYQAQVAYLLERSPFYREKLAGREPGELDRIAELPLTTKDELRASRTPGNPVGAHLCVERTELARIYSTSGTTGDPSYVPLTAEDVESWTVVSARGYEASGVQAGQTIVSTYNAGPWVAGAALTAFERIGLTHVPVGTGNTARLLRAIELLRPEAVVLTPSYAAHLAEEHAWLAESSVERVLVAGEPGGGERAFRARLEQGWGARVTEAMGVGDIGVSLFGECEQQDGMHLCADGYVHVELIDPVTEAALPLEDGASGELVLTHLRQRAAPLLRFRTRDHVVVRAGACPCGRSDIRIRCVGRTDDMLIVRGVNVFPAAVREVVAAFGDGVSGNVLVRPQSPGVKQEPPLPVAVELAREGAAEPGLAEAIRERIRDVLVVQTRIELVPWGTLQRSETKSRLVER